jgi:hypothetical protein
MAEQSNRRIRIIVQRNELEAVFSSMANSVVALPPTNDRHPFSIKEEDELRLPVSGIPWRWQT